MDTLKRLEEARQRGLTKEEYFHLMEMEVKLMEMRNQEVSPASVGQTQQSQTDIQQTLRDIQHQQVQQHEKLCRGIKVIVGQLEQLRQDQQDHQHNLGTQISELYRHVDSRLEASAQQIKEELRDIHAEVMNKAETGRSFIRDTIAGATGMKASVFNRIGEVTKSIKGNLHDVRKDIFSRVTALEGDFVNFDTVETKDPSLKLPDELIHRIQGGSARQKSRSVAQFEQSDDVTENETREGNDDVSTTENEESEKLHDIIGNKEWLRDKEKNLNPEDAQVHNGNPNPTREPLNNSGVVEQQDGVVVSHPVDICPHTSQTEDLLFKEYTESTARQNDEQAQQTTSDLPQETEDVSSSLDVSLPRSASSSGLDVLESNVDPTDGDDMASLNGRLIQDGLGSHQTSTQDNTSQTQESSRLTSAPLKTSSDPTTPSPQDTSLLSNTPFQTRETSFRASTGQEDQMANIVQHLEVLERLFYVVTQQSHQLLLNTLEDKLAQTLNVMVAIVTGVKHEICDVTEKEIQLVRDRLSREPRPRKHYVCDFYVQNIRSMVHLEDSQVSPPWHIYQMRSCVKGYVEVTGSGDMYVALMYGRHPSALGLTPRDRIKLKVKATVKDTTGNLPDVVVGDVTWNCNEAGVKDNRTWGKKIGVLSRESLVTQGYGQKEGYAFGSMLIRYDITVI